MLNDEYEVLLKKSVEVAPEWLVDDIKDIIDKAGILAGVSHVISQLNERYSFNIKHIITAIHFSNEWAMVSRERLNFIDNNVEIVVALYYNIKGKNKH